MGRLGNLGVARDFYVIDDSHGRCKSILRTYLLKDLDIKVDTLQLTGDRPKRLMYYGRLRIVF